MRLSESLTNEDVLRWLIDHMVGYRKQKRYRGKMAEIKGLKDRMLRLRQRIDNINQLANQADDAGAYLESELNDFHGQFTRHREDLVSAAGVIKNSSAASSEEQTIAADEVAPLHGDSAASTESGH